MLLEAVVTSRRQTGRWKRKQNKTKQTNNLNRRDRVRVGSRKLPVHPCQSPAYTGQKSLKMSEKSTSGRAPESSARLGHVCLNAVDEGCHLADDGGCPSPLQVVVSVLAPGTRWIIGRILSRLPAMNDRQSRYESSISEHHQCISHQQRVQRASVMKDPTSSTCPVAEGESLSKWISSSHDNCICRLVPCP